MDIFRYKTKEETVAMAGKKLGQLVHEAGGNPVLLMFSGGSALEVVDAIEPSVLGKNVTITMLDERYSTDPSINNFSHFALRKLYGEGNVKGAQYIDTRPRVTKVDKDNEFVETMEELTERFRSSLKAWKKNNAHGRVIITQGIGEDGHTAGMMPYPLQRERFEELFNVEATWVIGYDAQAAAKKTEDSSMQVDREKLRKSPRGLHVFAGDRMPFRGTSRLFAGPDPFSGAVKALWSSRTSSAGGVYPLRITVTIPFLHDVVDYSVVYVVGRNKRAVLERVLMERKRLWEAPARIIHEMKNVTVCTDIPQ